MINIDNLLILCGVCGLGMEAVWLGRVGVRCYKNWLKVKQEGVE